MPLAPASVESWSGVDMTTAAAPESASAACAMSFASVYEAHFSFVWRTVRRLGVEPSSVDDLVQEVFLVVHRRLADFEGRSSIKTWLFGIVRRVVHDHRRSKQRKPATPTEDFEGIAVDASTPYESTEKAEAVRLLHAMLDALEDERREVFVLAELEQMSAPEIAEATATNVNTVYTRLRAARKDFEASVARHRARAAHLEGKPGRPS
jgi:RNA polymerase sigma-70 factor (ECF subfamily)